MKTLITTLGALVALGCNAGDDSPSTADRSLAVEGEAFDTILVNFDRKAPEEQLYRAESLLSILNPLERDWSGALGPAAEQLRSAESDGSVDDEAVGYPDLKVSFRDSRYVSVTNASLTRDRRTDSADIGADAARQLLGEVVARGTEQGLLQPEYYDFENATLGRVKFGAALNTQVAEQHVKEYRFYVASLANGIQLSEGELRVGLHRTGGISHIRIGAPEIVDVSIEKVLRTVTDAELDERFKTEHPTVELHGVSLKYPVSSLSTGAQRVEPHRAYEFSPVTTSDDGTEVVGRRMWVYYSITNANASPTVVPEIEQSEGASGR